MIPGRRTRTRTLGTLAAALVLCALGATLLQPATASADPAAELQTVQQKIRQYNDDYAEAQQRVDEVQAQIDENQARIDELEAELPEARERAAASMRTLYKMQQSSGGLVELLLSADTFYDLLSTIQYLDTIQEHSTGAVDELLALADELELARVNLNSQMQEAEQQREEAQAALAEAEAARSELQAKIAAQAAAEEAERKAAIEAAKEKAKSEEKTFTTASGNEVQVETPPQKDPDPVDNGSDKDAFVSEWSARIDAYLAGSPLAGQGTTFAEAAWEYSVDPRFSPAISMVESTQGRYCFLPHNAWGWGSSSWASWEDAIWEHVAGLAAGYGGQLTLAGAKKYCPPNWEYWYATVLSEMGRI